MNKLFTIILIVILSNLNTFDSIQTLKRQFLSDEDNRMMLFTVHLLVGRVR